MKYVYIGNQMKLSVIIPVFNEKDTIREVLEKVKRSPVKKEIIIIDDGSNDGTKELLQDAQRKLTYNHDIKILYLDKNLGKGQAIKKGLSLAKGDYIIIQDADLEYDPNEYPKLLKPVLNKEADVVFGSRLLERNKNSRRDHFLYMGRTSISWATNILFGSHLTDVYTCFKLIPNDLVQNFDITANGFELEAELTAKILLSGKKIKEVPIDYNPRSKKAGKKITWIDWFIGVRMLLMLRFKKITRTSQ